MSVGGSWVSAARAAPLGRDGRVRMSGTYSTELGGVVNGTFQLRATSVTHRTVGP